MHAFLAVSLVKTHPFRLLSDLSSSRVTGDKKKSGVIRKYGLNMSRQVFREQAEFIGFKKVSDYKSRRRSKPTAEMLTVEYAVPVNAVEKKGSSDSSTG